MCPVDQSVKTTSACRIGQAGELLVAMSGMAGRGGSLITFVIDDASVITVVVVREPVIAERRLFHARSLVDCWPIIAVAQTSKLVHVGSPVQGYLNE